MLYLYVVVEQNETQTFNVGKVKIKNVFLGAASKKLQLFD